FLPPLAQLLLSLLLGHCLQLLRIEVRHTVPTGKIFPVEQGMKSFRRLDVCRNGTWRGPNQENQSKHENRNALHGVNSTVGRVEEGRATHHRCVRPCGTNGSRPSHRRRAARWEPASATCNVSVIRELEWPPGTNRI